MDNKIFDNIPCGPDGCPVPGHHHPAPCDPCCPPAPCPGEPCFTPVPPPVPPIHFIPGMNVQEQMCHVINSANEAINRWNFIQANCYQALNKMVGAAVCNDVYYDRDEVWLESGYDTNDECKYSVIHVRAVDKAGQPIRMRLYLAYGNTTNSNLKQSMQDASFLTNANAIITAVSPDQNGWKGSTRYMGAPIAGTTETSGYIAGFNRHGALKVFPANTDDITLCQNQIENIIGFATPVVKDGTVTDEAKALTTKGAVSAIGYKSSNGEKIFFYCSAQDANGMQGVTVANVLKDMGCTTAVITSIIAPSENATNSNGMMYMGALTDAPVGWAIPQNVAYWVVTKRPFGGWRNQFTSEIADLVQRTGQNWNAIQSTRHRVEQVYEIADEALDLAKDNADRIVVLEQEVKDINTELDEIQEHLTTHDQQIEKLQTDLAQEVTDRQEADKQLQENIDAEAAAREEADKQLQAAIEKEVADRTAADAVLQGNINQEAIDRANADLKIEQNLATEISNRTEGDQILQNQINNIINGTTTMPYVKLAGDTMTGALILSGNASVALQAVPKQQLDAAVTSLTEQINNIISGTTGMPYVKKVGDTMTGPLKFDINSITEPTGSVIYGDSNHLALGTASDTQNYASILLERTDDPSVVLNASKSGEVVRSAYIKLVHNSMNVHVGMVNLSLSYLNGLSLLNTAKITEVLPGTDTNDVVTLGQIKDGSALPVATAETLGVVKVGANLTITPDGVLNATGGGGGGGDYVAGDGITISGNTIAVNKTYLNGLYLPLTGGKMSGPIEIGGTTIESVGTTGIKISDANGAQLQIDQGGVLITSATGGAVSLGNVKLTDVADPSGNADAVTLGYLTEHVGEGPFLPLSGGTVTGPVTFNNNINLTNAIQWDSGNTRIAWDSTGLKLTSGENLFIQVAGNIVANDSKITKVADPEAEQDAVNKRYVDSHTGSGELTVTGGNVPCIDGTTTALTITPSGATINRAFMNSGKLVLDITATGQAVDIQLDVGQGVIMNPDGLSINKGNGNIEEQYKTSSNSSVNLRFLNMGKGDSYYILVGSNYALSNADPSFYDFTIIK